MSGFHQMAKSLISQTLPPPAKHGESVEAKLDHITLMSKEGFSPREVFRDLRELYDSCQDEDKGIKLQISKLMIQVHGMLNSEDVSRVAPAFTLVIQGDNNKVMGMLCPNSITV